MKSPFPVDDLGRRIHYLIAVYSSDKLSFCILEYNVQYTWIR